jgi:hypothetical protein
MGNQIIVESTHFSRGPAQKVTYNLDGSYRVWKAPWVSHNGTTTELSWRSRAHWDGNALVLYTWNMAGRHVQMRDSLTLTGGALTIVRFVEEGAPTMANGTITYTKGT